MADEAIDNQDSDVTPPAQPETASKRDLSFTPDDPDMIQAFHLQENPKNVPYGPTTRSGERAKGPMQFMQATWDAVADKGDDIFDETASKKNSQKLLNTLYNKYGTMELAAAAYNAGEPVIDKYRAQTKDGTWSEVKDLMAQKGSYEETQKYVPGVLGKYQSIKDGSIKWISQHPEHAPATASDFADDDEPQKVSGNLQDFKTQLSDIFESPGFQTGSATEQVRALNRLEQSGKWTPEVYPFIKTQASLLWQGAQPEESPDFKELVGTPPVVQNGQNVEEVLNAWKYDASHRVVQEAGVKPALLGSQFDDYVDQAANDEKDAYALRNRGAISNVAHITGGVLAAAGAGAMSTITTPIAGAVRLASGGNETLTAKADAVQKIPEDYLGSSFDHGFYAKDENNRIIRNPDGTPKATWQENISQTVGAIPALISGAGAVKGVFGLSQAQIGTGIFTTNALSSANGLFKQTLEETGDVKKAYAVSLAAIPEAAAMTLPELGVLGGQFRPALRSLSLYDKGRFIAQSMATNAARMGAGGAAANLVHQTAVNKEFSGTELAESTIANAVGGAIGGGFYDYFGGQKAYREGKAQEVRDEGLKNVAAEHMSDFRNSLDSKKTISLDTKYFDQNALDFNGLHVENSANGTTTLAKNLDVNPGPINPEETGRIVEHIKALPTPNDLPAIDERLTALHDASTIRELTPEEGQEKGLLTQTKLAMQHPDYLHEVQRNENALRAVLEHPEALDHLTNNDIPNITYDAEDRSWRDVESGERAPFARDLLNKPASENRPVFQDLSDIEHLKIVDGDINEIAKNKLQGNLGAHTSKNGTIYIKAGLPQPVKTELYAHEVAHGIQDKLQLPEYVKEALNTVRADIEEEAKVSTADEIASKALLPNVKAAVKIPDLKASKLYPKSKEALWGAREFMANQVAAVMLKRSGADIGDYHIVPELEQHLEHVILPEVKNAQSSSPTRPAEQISAPEVQGNEPGTTNEQPGVPKQSDINSQELKRPASETENPVQFTSETKKELALPYSTGSERPDIDSRTGDTAETAFSKTLREAVPEASPADYDVRSRDIAHEKAQKLISDKGVDYIIKELSNEHSFLSRTPERAAIADQLLLKTDADYQANPTPENAEKTYQAAQLRAKALTTAAQTLSLAAQFRGADTFGQFYLTLKNILKTAGLESDFTDYQLGELKGRFDKFKAAPEGKIKDSLALESIEQGIKNVKLTPAQFFKQYYKNNLLSGPSTLVRVATGHGLMGPVFTGLSHPIYGGFMAWKVMADALPLIKAESALIFKGQSIGEVDHLVSGLLSTDPVKLTTTERAAEGLQKFYDKFGKFVPRTLNAISNAMTELSTRAGMTHEKFQELKAQYKDNPEGFTTAVSKLLTPKESLDRALAQAKNESDSGRLGLNKNQQMVRAYEILDNERFNEADKAYGQEYGDSVSLRGPVANLGNKLIDNIFNNAKWSQTPILKFAKDTAFPFINALNHITDFSMDLVPGSFLVNHADTIFEYTQAKLKGGTEGTIPPSLTGRSEALQNRLIAGQIIGSTITAGLMLALRSGEIQITGEPEVVLNKSGGKIGGEARTGAKIREFEQKGIPEHSIIIPSLGISFKYDDLPGLNLLAVGIHNANKALDNGEGAIGAAAQFYKNAFLAGVPIWGNGSLNRPYKDFIKTMVSPENEGGGVINAVQKFAKNAQQGLIPFSGLLKNVQKAYDNPEDSHGGPLTNAFKNVPGLSSLLGSNPSLDRFGRPIERSFLEHTPLSAVVDTKATATSPVWEKLNQRGLIVPEMNAGIKFNKGDFSSPAAQNNFTTKRAEDRLTKAYANTFSPQEWYDFRKAVGPFVERAANQVASSNMRTEDAQKLLNQRVKDIETQAKKRYIASGRFD